MKKLILLAIMLLSTVSCATTQIAGLGAAWQNRDVYLETDTRPTKVLRNAKITSVAVMRFDAKSVRTEGGQIIDYISLGNNFTDDLMAVLYEQGRIKVAAGEYEDTIVERDYFERKMGDLEIRTSQMERSITYKAVPYKKIEGILSGRIEKYEAGASFEKSFLEINLRLVSTYDGEIYWITKMRGFYKDIIYTIAETISQGEYIEPVSTKAVDNAKEKEEKTLEKVDEDIIE